MYAKLNISIILIGVLTWNSGDLIPLSSDAVDDVIKFATYHSSLQHIYPTHDSAMLITLVVINC